MSGGMTACGSCCLQRRSASTGSIPPLFSHFGSRSVKERITAVLKQQKRSLWRTLAACLLVAVTLTVFATGAAAKPAAPPPRAGGSYFPRELCHCIGFCSDKPEELSGVLKLTTMTGEPYTLANGESFVYYLNDQAVERGTVYGTVYRGPGDYLVLESEFSLLSACGGAPAEDAPFGWPDPPQVEQKNDKLTVYCLDVGKGSRMMEKTATLFRASHPGIPIELVREDLNAGQGYDAYQQMATEIMVGGGTPFPCATISSSMSRPGRP